MRSPVGAMAPAAGHTADPRDKGAGEAERSRRRRLDGVRRGGLPRRSRRQVQAPHAGVQILDPVAAHAGIGEVREA